MALILHSQASRHLLPFESMFHKMQDRVVAAASNTLGIANTTTNIENERSAASHTMTTVQSLQALGHCTVTEVESALHTADENIDLAAEIILSQPQQQQQPQRLMLTNTANTTDQMDEDMELQRALQQSLDMQEQQQPSCSDIMNQTAEDAFRRADMTNNSMKKKKNPLNAPAAMTQKSDAPKPTVVPARPLRTKSELLRQHHPDVKLIPKLQDKSIEEQILRTVDRMKHHSEANLICSKADNHK